MDIEKFREFRKHVPAAQSQAYFETAATGLIPDFVYQAVKQYQDSRYFCGGDSVWIYEDGQSLTTLEMMERSKAALAEMVRCRKENLIFGQNSSQLYALFTGTMDFEPGDNVVLPDGGWMSNRFAWQIREKDGLELRYAPTEEGVLTPEAVIALCDERTRAVAVTYVESSTGFRLDIETLGRFCRERDIWLVADGVQALGVLPVDVQRDGVDFLVGNDYKWMMNYCGTGYAYISPRLLPRLRQRTAGWMSDDQRFNTEKPVLRLREDAGRFELGFPTVSGICGIGLVAEQYNRLGREDIEAYVLGLMEDLSDQIGNLDGVEMLHHYEKKNRSAIADIVLSQRIGLTDEELQKRGVFAHVRPFGDDGKQLMRVSLHYYNNKEDVDRLIGAISRKG